MTVDDIIILACTFVSLEKPGLGRTFPTLGHRAIVHMLCSLIAGRSEKGWD